MTCRVTTADSCNLRDPKCNSQGERPLPTQSRHHEATTTTSNRTRKVRFSMAYYHRSLRLCSATRISPIRDIDSGNVVESRSPFAQESAQQGHAAPKAAPPSCLRELIPMWDGWPTLRA